MAKTVRRGGKTVRRAAKRQGTKAKVNRARAKGNSLWGGVLALLPFTEEQVHRFLVVVILGSIALATYWVASLAGLTTMAHQRYAAVAADAGFEVKRVEVRGVDRMNELKIYERVLGAKNRAMPLVNVHEVRSELVDLPWVKDARVSRQLPDTLVVDVVERKPHAVLRKPDRYVLIDKDGEELEPIAKKNTKGMLVISGPGSGQQVAALSKLLDSAPALRSKVSAAEWIGNRRWNITFNTDQVLALPQGDEESAQAFIKFAQMDGRNRVLGGDLATIDMRNPGRIYARKKGEQGDAR